MRSHLNVFLSRQDGSEPGTGDDGHCHRHLVFNRSRRSRFHRDDLRHAIVQENLQDIDAVVKNDIPDKDDKVGLEVNIWHLLAGLEG
jgi:hypothetical protein